MAVEALVRWPHPTAGLLRPAAFLPLAEQAGLTGDVARWVLDTAMRQAMIWHRQGWPLRVHVNLTLADLRKSALPPLISTLLTRYGLAADRLCLEVAEAPSRPILYAPKARWRR